MVQAETMKVLFYHLMPFALAHGGLQIQILQSRSALAQLGVEVEFLRWDDPDQSGDILHFFGRVPFELLEHAQERGMKVVQAELLTEPGARPRARLALEKMAPLVWSRMLPWVMTRGYNWESYRLADASVALTEWEAYLMKHVYGAPPGKTHVVPNGVEEVFLNRQPAKRGPWLVCTATITERKRVLELAEAAVLARTPLWILGKPYSGVGCLCATVRSAGQSQFGHPALRRRDTGSGKTGAGLSRSPGVRTVERDGKPEPVGPRSRRV
jgi:hypothetical protein